MRIRRRHKLMESGTAWHWYLLAGILVLLLLVMAFATMQRLSNAEQLMSAHIAHQGEMLLRSLEQATRASLRRGFFRQQLLQTLAEEVLDDERVKSVTILDAQGGILALSRMAPDKDKIKDPLDGLPKKIKQNIAQRKHVESFVDGEFVLGRVFDPLRPNRDWFPADNRRSDRRSDSDDQRGMHRGSRRRGMPMMSNLPPWLAPGHMGNDDSLAPYALVRLSTKALDDARFRAIRGAVIMGGLIFLAAAIAAWGMWAVARRRSREIDRLKREVAEAGHMAAVGRLAASVAHEVRNPLSAVRGLVQYLAKDFEPKSRQAEYAQAAVEEVDRLERVVSGLLDYSRPRKLRLLDTDLAESLNSVANLFKDDPRAQGVDIQVVVPETQETLKVDPDQVRQVLVNLVINGLEALDGRGALQLMLKLDNGQAHIKVQDDGPGLGENDPEALFDPFFSTKERGTGLGLAIARRIARAHGGDLSAQNAPGGGACFTLTLPRNGSMQ